MPTNTVTPEDVPQDQDPDRITLTHDELFEVMCELRPPGVSDAQIEAIAARFHGVTVRISAVRAAEAELKKGA